MTIQDIENQIDDIQDELNSFDDSTVNSTYVSKEYKNYLIDQLEILHASKINKIANESGFNE